MSANPKSSAIARRLAFFKGLQALTARVHETHNIDEIISEVSGEVCSLFGAQRLTIYTLDESRTSISSRVKTGLPGARSIRLPLSEKSIAGYVAVTRRLINLRDVYSKAELA